MAIDRSQFGTFLLNNAPMPQQLVQFVGKADSPDGEAGPFSLRLGPVGGGGGDTFEDLVPAPGSNIEMASIQIFSGNFIDRIQIQYRDVATQAIVSTFTHGGGGGRLTFSLTLQPGEFIIGLHGRCGEFIDSMSVVTTIQQHDRVGGGGGSIDYDWNVAQGFEIIAIHGRAGNFIDGLGAFVNKRP